MFTLIRLLLCVVYLIYFQFQEESHMRNAGFLRFEYVQINKMTTGPQMDFIMCWN